jgi:steroid 5-alpha reductase family enzyme
MTFILTRGTGARMTDRRMLASRPHYADYVARTSGFFPLPPRRNLPPPPPGG